MTIAFYDDDQVAAIRPAEKTGLGKAETASLQASVLRRMESVGEGALLNIGADLMAEYEAAKKTHN